MDRIYNGFVARVAEGRKMTVAAGRRHRQGPRLDRRAGQGARPGRLPRRLPAGGRPRQGAGRHQGEARLKPFADVANPFAALARLFGAGADSARLMAAACELSHDPEARALIESLHEARLRQAGATVLAPMPPLSGR